MRTVTFTSTFGRSIACGLALALGVIAATVVTPATAQTPYPDRPVRVVIPYAAGGGTDILMRYLMNRIEQTEGLRVLIDNRPGATGAIGAREVAKARPDGYTLLAGHIAPNAINPGDFTDPKFAADWPLVEVALAAEAPSLLLVQNDLNVSNVAELKKWLRGQKNPTYGSDGLGSLAHLQMEFLMGGFAMTHIPYKGGGPAMTGFMTREVPVLFSPAPVAIPFTAGGKFRVIAQTGSSRLTTLPNVPTMVEAGEKEFSAPLWWGLFAPVGTPDDIRQRWNAAVNKALADPVVIKWMADQGYTPRPMSVNEFRDYVAAEIRRWNKVVAGINAR
jgi:tripartite-type tricarboxylate transporter receptor subunit TctC